jgi:hypothetical protein
MDYENVDAVEFGRSLRGIGLNLLVRDVTGLCQFLADVFSMQVLRQSADFAIVRYQEQVFQLHADHTYHSHPLPSLLPENGARGGGIEIRLYDTDPDTAATLAAAHAHDATQLEPPTNKPHGLRECIILCENGYAWAPSRQLTDDEAAAAK